MSEWQKARNRPTRITVPVNVTFTVHADNPRKAVSEAIKGLFYGVTGYGIDVGHYSVEVVERRRHRCERAS